MSVLYCFESCLRVDSQHHLNVPQAKLEALEAVPALPDMPLAAAVRTPAFWMLGLQVGPRMRDTHNAQPLTTKSSA